MRFCWAAQYKSLPGVGGNAQTHGHVSMASLCLCRHIESKSKGKAKPQAKAKAKGKAGKGKATPNRNSAFHQVYRYQITSSNVLWLQKQAMDRQIDVPFKQITHPTNKRPQMMGQTQPTNKWDSQAS